MTASCRQPKPKKTPWTQPIQGLMRLGAMSCANLAQELGVSRSLVSKVVLGQRESAEIESALCAALELPFSRLGENAAELHSIYVQRLTAHELELAQSRIMDQLSPLQSTERQRSVA